MSGGTRGRRTGGRRPHDATEEDVHDERRAEGDTDAGAGLDNPATMERLLVAMAKAQIMACGGTPAGNDDLETVT